MQNYKDLIIAPTKTHDKYINVSWKEKVCRNPPSDGVAVGAL